MGDVEKGLSNFGDKVGTEIFESIDKNITEAAKSSNPFEKAGAVFLESIKKMFEQEMKGGSSLPSQTTTQRNAITPTYVTNGAIIYNSSTSKFQGYVGTGWTDFN